MEIAKKNHLEKTFKSFSHSVLGITLPFLLSLIPIFIVKDYCQIMTFLDDGQFLIFGAGLFTSAYFLFTENYKSVIKRRDKLLSGICFWAIIACSAFYSILYALKITKFNLPIDFVLIRLSSILLFVLAMYTFYRSIHIDFLKLYPEVDVKAESVKEVDSIIDQLNK